MILYTWVVVSCDIIHMIRYVIGLIVVIWGDKFMLAHSLYIYIKDIYAFIPGVSYSPWF